MKNEKTANAKQKIYETAKKLYIEYGYFNISNKRLAEESSVNQGLITYYFKSKRNIALAVLSEDYHILSGYLKYFITPEENPLIYIMSFMHATFRIRKNDPKARQFISDVMQEDLLEEFALLDQKQDYIKLLKRVGTSEAILEKRLRMVLATVYGTQRTMQRLINENGELDYDEYFRYMVELLLFALGQPYDQEEVDRIVEKCAGATNELFEKYPQLLNESLYLYHL
ncbi:MAG: TetR/AcrR family transcriptional regulator [Eubacterium sp.]